MHHQFRVGRIGDNILFAAQGGGTEGTAHPAAHLRGDADGIAVVIMHEHRLHAVPVGQPPQVFDGAVLLGFLPAHRLRGEKALDSLLYGKPGLAKKVPLTKDIVNWTDIPPVDGYNIRTTIDINMQDIVENELNNVLTTCDADWGVAVLMEVSTGNIKAISNLEKSPYSNEYIEGMNRAVLGYEPGSTRPSSSTKHWKKF